MQATNSISLIGVLILAGLGLTLAWLAWRNDSASKQRSGAARPTGGSQAKAVLSRDVDVLFADITRGLRTLSSSSKLGGMGLMRERQAEVRRLLFELQRRLRSLEDGARDKYEARVYRILAQAARFDITLPPP